MNNYKYFEQDGEKYHLKAQFVFIAFLGGIFLLGGLLLAFTKGSADKAVMWIGYAMALLGALVLLRLTTKTTIDMENRQILFKRHFLTSEVAYSLDNFETFVVASTVSLFGITMNGAVNMVLNINGKEKLLMLNQSIFTVAPLNNMVNEALQIMKLED
ncbi:hypothetical protein HDE68_000086 [Pedobacter cryoconitis]|uniref:Uncharacterized protein n=1 Tax=Pedobacter cryoconitis TaxID=188932 RepID=A0A7W8ZHN5_9SPHI|nr:hypothetical protein [Pedobacter cryoconitis]MBB5634201.1 hypothetical protein [Pedobacter cryoconitis]